MAKQINVVAAVVIDEAKLLAGRGPLGRRLLGVAGGQAQTR